MHSAVAVLCFSNWGPLTSAGTQQTRPNWRARVLTILSHVSKDYASLASFSRNGSTPLDCFKDSMALEGCSSGCFLIACTFVQTSECIFLIPCQLIYPFVSLKENHLNDFFHIIQWNNIKQQNVCPFICARMGYKSRNTRNYFVLLNWFHDVHQKQTQAQIGTLH